MGFFSWLFGNQKKVESPVGAVKDRHKSVIKLTGSLMHIDSIGWYGLFKKSPGRNWAVSWRDSTPDGSIGGNRESGEGRYLLVDLQTGTVAAQGTMPRPNGGNVANNGTFSLEDWHFGSSLSGTFHVYSADGTPILTRTFTANILESGLSKNGKLAYCMTANSPTEDAGKLTLFDLTTGHVVFSVRPRRFGADSIEFDEKKRELVFKVSGGGEYRYGADGAILDEDSVDDAFLNSSDYSAVILTAETMLKRASSSLAPEKHQEILGALIRARSIGADQNPAWKPTALKVQGMAHEALSQVEEAIACYEEALGLNAKIGVKRRLDTLRKRTGGFF
jgi:hypothetical protein